MTKKIAVSQSNYIPWKGYFDLIASSDVFVLYDDMQYTKRDWRNRNKIKTIDGEKWLTIPVSVKGRYFQKINETKISDSSWQKKHWRTICQNYSKANFFDEFIIYLEKIYLLNKYEYLSDVNRDLIFELCNILGISTKIINSSEFKLQSGKNESLLGICKDLGATHYISGPSAKDYMNESLFEKNNIHVGWMDYSNYPEYDQLFGSFCHNVSVLDLIFSKGHEAKNFMKNVK